ncbi:pyridoxal phosphate-dependent aminotransferase [Pyrobaculum neutrophilum]|uniref:Aminotransferase class I and II n=1 Tax=Pyrobaculum neutrophilum (strain DSM 2338 / JCM 9278 / NBRC 100436 / V24Sta) TaxID=444157 RepID=B1YDK4_PYRNV|nr:aminotransferase class I/II-fold pyridoxal phosphate-dependent enzyme [Pyrobaculum neutrophilum]ACB39867.1 aminotransferase class I and II [Pyrobaculum neutrophilum V24Sta]
MFKWIRERPAEYDLASSGVAKIEVEPADEPPVGEILTSLYRISPRELALTAGAQEGLFLAFHAVRPKAVVTVAPEYEPIWRLPGAMGVRHVEVRDVWEAPLGPETALVFSNPNNPTGRFLGRGELRELADEARRRGAVLIVDIIFSDFVTDDLGGLPLENAVYVHSTDKFYTSDYRLGWAFGDSRIVEKIRALKDLANPGPRDLEKRAAAALLSRREEVKRRNLAVIDKNAAALLSAFPNAIYNPHMPIALVEVGCDDVAFAEGLLKRGVKVMPGTFMKAPRAVRVGLGVEPPPRFTQALGILGEAAGNCRT